MTYATCSPQGYALISRYSILTGSQRPQIPSDQDEPDTSVPALQTRTREERLKTASSWRVRYCQRRLKQRQRLLSQRFDDLLGSFSLNVRREHAGIDALISTIPSAGSVWTREPCLMRHGFGCRYGGSVVVVAAEPVPFGRGSISIRRPERKITISG
ncbi:hypothetical protein F3Y22_tig00110264pilonHSYRG00376 [Hibiscus syriacus]|uniref:Uncharacterized protein n=1 Tax=Hibiscus syriacus TaxID=106335 RepID=A0A6A3B9H8_HIBSY|nr:hypothetical protein F3Y22_tig00110264pilonHSYRG00376 [Hibiscus syriacus]